MFVAWCYRRSDRGHTTFANGYANGLSLTNQPMPRQATLGTTRLRHKGCGLHGTDFKINLTQCKQMLEEGHYPGAAPKSVVALSASVTREGGQVVCAKRLR